MGDDLRKSPKFDRTWGDPGFRGRGVIMCAGCGQPLRDHVLTAPCPELMGEDLSNPGPRKQRRDAPDTAPTPNKPK